MHRIPHIILMLAVSSAAAVHLIARSAEDENNQCWRYLAPNEKIDISHSRIKSTGFHISSSKIQKFVIFSTLRSGSNLLSHTLDELPGVMSNSEIFSTDGIWTSRWLRNWKDGTNRDDFLSKWDVAARDRDRGGFVNALSRHALDRNFSHCGFKVLAKQLYEPEFQSLARAPYIKKIILYRRNVLRQYVSKLKADALSEWYGADTSNVQVHVNITEFLWFSEDVAMCYNRCLIPSMAPKTWLSVAYEDLVNNYDNTMSSILSFLQYAGPTQRATHMIKQDNSTLFDSVENIMEVVQALSNTTYKKHMGHGMTTHIAPF